jgi:hypothetical protein
MSEVLGVIWAGREAEYFCGRGWTGQITLKSLQKIARPRSARSGRSRRAGAVILFAPW